MSEEELREEATSTVEWESTPMIDRPLFVFAYVKGALTREKRIEELEKEIKDNEDLATVAYMQGAENQKKKFEKQLTKAKQIIKELYKCFDKLYLSGLTDKQIAFVERLQDKTEQFLKEVEA